MTTPSESLRKNMEKWEQYDGEIPLNTVRAWSVEILENTPWTFSGWTGNPKEPYRHWSYCAELEGLYKQIWLSMKPSFPHLKPDRILVNLFNHGDSSWTHKDSEKSSDRTVLIFLNDYWNIDWGGELGLFENEELVKAFTPKPGRYVLFNSNMVHGARPVSREAPYPRLAIAYQCSDDSKL